MHLALYGFVRWHVQAAEDKLKADEEAKQKAEEAERRAEADRQAEAQRKAAEDKQAEQARKEAADKAAAAAKAEQEADAKAKQEAEARQQAEKEAAAKQEQQRQEFEQHVHMQVLHVWQACMLAGTVKESLRIYALVAHRPWPLAYSNAFGVPWHFTKSLAPYVRKNAMSLHFYTCLFPVLIFIHCWST